MAGQLMRCPISLHPVSAFLVCIVLLSSCTAASPILTTQEADSDFLECISFNTLHTKLPVYTPNTTSYTSILQSKIQNLRFSFDPDAVPLNKPRFIVTPTHESHVQAIVVCSKKHGLQSRVRSGGHDFEGLSYRSNVPFVLIDLFNLRTIDVNIGDDSAWVEAGATLGEVYYRIAEKSPVHAFSAGKAGATLACSGESGVGGIGGSGGSCGSGSDGSGGCGGSGGAVAVAGWCSDISGLRTVERDAATLVMQQMMLVMQQVQRG